MRRTAGVIALAGLAVTFAITQRGGAQQSETPAFEVRALFPREVSPARYEQVDQRELQTLAEQGWELVSVEPFVYRNEERGGERVYPKPTVTQTYPAYFFKRVRIVRRAG
jgi:hypothetical protein